MISTSTRTRLMQQRPTAAAGRRVRAPTATECLPRLPVARSPAAKGGGRHTPACPPRPPPPQLLTTTHGAPPPLPRTAADLFLQVCCSSMISHRGPHGAAAAGSAQAAAADAADAAPPSFLPAEFLAEIVEPAAQAMAARMRRIPVELPTLPSLPGPLATAFVGPSAAQRAALVATGSSDGSSSSSRPAPVVLLHGFDSSCLEFRRLLPLLESHTETWAVDLVRQMCCLSHIQQHPLPPACLQCLPSTAQRQLT